MSTIAASGGPPLGRLELVDDVAAGLARRADGPRSGRRRRAGAAPIGRLAAAARVEDGPVEDDQRRLAVASTASTRASMVRA